jgi:hypothetical protein
VLRRGRRREREDEDEAGAFEPVPVPVEHRESLEAHMDVLRMAIELEGPCDYGDKPGAEPHNREQFLAHFGELEAQLEEWDARVERVRAAPNALWNWFARGASRHGITEPPFALGPLIDRLAILTAERSRKGQLEMPRALALEHFRDRIAGGECLSLYLEGQNISQLPAEPKATAQARVDAASQLVQALFDDAQASNQAHEIVDAHEALLDLKQPLLDRLAVHASVDAIMLAPDCPECRRLRQSGGGERAGASAPGAGEGGASAEASDAAEA